MPECEFAVNNRDLQYNQPWVNYAIPFKNDKPDNCYRFAPKNWTAAQCNADMFDVFTKIPCTEYVHATDERNLQTEVIFRLLANK